jgi:hypothetical protein
MHENARYGSEKENDYGHFILVFDEKSSTSLYGKAC